MLGCEGLNAVAASRPPKQHAYRSRLFERTVSISGSDFAGLHDVSSLIPYPRVTLTTFPWRFHSSKKNFFDIYFSKDNLWTTMLFSSARLRVIDQQAQLIFALSPVVNAVIS